MSLFKKIGKGLKKATKAVGKGIGNAAKFTAKNPLKVLAPIAGVAATIATAGAVAPALAGKLAATKVGGTVFGKMVTATMKTGTVVREKIADTLKKQGKPATSKDIDTVEQGIQAEVTKKKGHRLPVDRTSKTGTEARAKLKTISEKLTAKALNRPESRTIQAERTVLQNAGINGIIPKSEVPAEVMDEMYNAGEIKKNLLGTAVSGVSQLLGLNPAIQQKAADAVSILTGQSNAPYLQEDMNEGIQLIEREQNVNAASFGGILEILKKPIVVIIGAAALVGFLIVNSNKNKSNRR